MGMSYMVRLNVSDASSGRIERSITERTVIISPVCIF